MGGCINNKCVYNCALEGEEVYRLESYGPTYCCNESAGIKPPFKIISNWNVCIIPSNNYLEGTCVINWDQTCGNGVCEEDLGEDKCTCHKDCGEGERLSNILEKDAYLYY